MEKYMTNAQVFWNARTLGKFKDSLGVAVLPHPQIADN